MASEAGRDPRHHTQKMQARLQETIDHLREDIEKVDEPQLKAMFETAAEVLGGLKKAFSDYEKKNEAAWRVENATKAGIASRGRASSSLSGMTNLTSANPLAQLSSSRCIAECRHSQAFLVLFRLISSMPATESVGILDHELRPE